MDADEHFEDFTTASDWESFTARLESILTEWMGKPYEQDNVHNNWLVLHERVMFSDFPFKFTYCKYLKENQNLSTSASCYGLESLGNGTNSSTVTRIPPYLHSAVSTDREFPPSFAPHVVAEYFNVKEFAVLTSSGLEPVQSESRLKVILSSCCMALNNSNCNFPIFVQFHHWTQGYFAGIAEFSGIRTAFNMVMLKQNGSLPSYLSGLLDVFKSKIGTNLPVPVGVTAHFFYRLKTWDAEFTCDSFPPELYELIQSEETEPSEISSESVSWWSQFVAQINLLPIGSVEDPFLHLDFVAGWPSITEDVVVDSASYSDLEPDNAQEWFFSLKPDSNADYRLTDLVENIWAMRGNGKTIEQILGKRIDDDQGGLRYSSALDKLTRTAMPDIPVSGISRALNNAQRQVLYTESFDDLPPLNKSEMDSIVQFLFPDSLKTHRLAYPETLGARPNFQKECISSALDELNGVKSAPIGSLTWRLAIVIAYLYKYGGGASVVAQTWAEFILELRYRVENSRRICGLEPGTPNNGTCLLNQKLQMLNFCIDKKLSREELARKQNLDPDTVESGCEESDNEDDEFFDCDDQFFDCDDPSGKVVKLNKPCGRLRKNGRLRLIKNGEPMYIPVTQNPGPLTEDVIEEQSKILIELGDDAQASEVRAKMMSASLFSDMESFKAANPSAELEDFVRWYSPRDWIESDEADDLGNKIGSLSPRMKMPGNMWMEVWSTAQPIPARRQKRLFDDTKEAEKILHWLSSRSLCDISSLLFPCLSHAAAMKVLEEADKLPFEYRVPSNFLQTLVHLSRSFSCVLNPSNDFSELTSYKNQFLSILTQAEREITQIKSFVMKFPSVNLQTILQTKESDSDSYGNDFLPSFIKIEDVEAAEDTLKIIKVMFQKEMLQSSQFVDNNLEFKFGKSFKRVFVLKYNPSRTSESSNVVASLPQRMSCLLTEEKVTLAGTFSSKTDLN